MTTRSARRSTSTATAPRCATCTTRRWTAPRTAAGRPAPRTSTCTTPPAWPTTSSSTWPRAPAPPPYGTSPVCGSAPAVTGIGRAKAEKIWFRALDVYFTSNTRYVNTTNPANTARAYTLSRRDRPVRPVLHRVQDRPGGLDRGQRGRQRRRLPGRQRLLRLGLADLRLDQPGRLGHRHRRAPPSPTARPQTVTFSATGLPTGATASFSPTSVTAGGSSTHDDQHRRPAPRRAPTRSPSPAPAPSNSHARRTR